MIEIRSGYIKMRTTDNKPIAIPIGTGYFVWRDSTSCNVYLTMEVGFSWIVDENFSNIMDAIDKYEELK